MKHRIIAVLVLASAAVVQIQAAEAGPLLDALRNKAGQAVFLGKVAKANLGTAAHHLKVAVTNKIFACFRPDGCKLIFWDKPCAPPCARGAVGLGLNVSYRPSESGAYSFARLFWETRYRWGLTTGSQRTCNSQDQKDRAVTLFGRRDIRYRPGYRITSQRTLSVSVQVHGDAQLDRDRYRFD